jgi:aspartate/methionine/tyrosine aminotransferase
MRDNDRDGRNRTVVFPRLNTGGVDRLCSILRGKYDTTVVPGSLFEMPDHFRLGIACPTDMLAEGLDRLGLALAEL